MFIYALGRDGAISALRERAARLEAEISRSDAFRLAVLADLGDFPRIFAIEEEYAQAMRKAELAWVRGTVAELVDGSLAWPAARRTAGGGKPALVKRKQKKRSPGRQPRRPREPGARLCRLQPGLGTSRIVPASAAPAHQVKEHGNASNRVTTCRDPGAWPAQVIPGQGRRRSRRSADSTSPSRPVRSSASWARTGQGKTTTLRILTTLLPADAGEAFVAGIDVMRSPQQVPRRPLWRSGGEPAATTVRWPELRYLAGPSVRVAVTPPSCSAS